MKAEHLLTYMELADPAYVEEASDQNILRLRGRRRRAVWTACACLAVILVVGAVFAEPAMTAWDLRNTVVSWPSFVFPGASVEPSSGVYISAELPTRGKMDADAPFTLSVGLGQATNYEYATLVVNAPGFEITDPEGNTVTDRYVRTISGFDSDDYGILYNSFHNVTGCAYLEDFTFRYLGGDGEGSVSISLLSRNVNGSAGDSVGIYYSVANGALKLTDKRPSDTMGNGVTLEEETAKGDTSLSKEDISVQADLRTPALRPRDDLASALTVTACYLPTGEAYATESFTAELVYAETLREKHFSFYAKKPAETTEEGIHLLFAPRVPEDAPVGAYDLVVIDEVTGFVWIFENFTFVLPSDDPAYEDFICEATTDSPYLTRGEKWSDKIRIQLSEYELDLHPEYEDETLLSLFAYAYLQYEGQEAYKIRLIEPSYSSFLPNGSIPDDAPFGSYTLVVVHTEYGYTWRFENFVEVIDITEPT